MEFLPYIALAVSAAVFIRQEMVFRKDARLDRETAQEYLNGADRLRSPHNCAICDALLKGDPLN